MTKYEYPGFQYMLLTGSCFNSYYVFQNDELEKALQQLRAEHAKGHQIAYLGIVHLCPDGTYRLKKYMRFENNQTVYDEYGRIGLHVQFYMEAGRRLN